jgi:hypothetical protein
MEFTNLTGFPAKFQPGGTTDSEMLGIVASKVTYLTEGARLVPVTDETQAWPVFDKPFFFRGVSLAQELEFRKRGIDVLVFGNAVVPAREPVPEMEVAIRSGRLDYRVRVIGDRIWNRSAGGLAPSEPKPFSEMPLTNERAYGGVATFDGADFHHAVNPDGRGFYMEEDQAAGGAMPNLERPDEPIGAWTDNPKPACLFKPTGRHMDADAPGDDPYASMPRVLRDTFNQAVPELVVEPGDLGERLELFGFDRRGALALPLPPVNGPTAHVAVGKLRSRFPSTLSTLLVLVPEGVVIATYLCLFRYLFRPQEKRTVMLRWSEAGEPAAAGGARG